MNESIKAEGIQVSVAERNEIDTEIEVKYRFTDPEKAKGLAMLAEKSKFLIQAYPCVDMDYGSETRVRQTTVSSEAGGVEESFEITVKSKGDYTRGEVNSPVTKEVAEQLFNLSGDRVLTKTRYVVPYEVLFENVLNGVEFNQLDAHVVEILSTLKLELDIYENDYEGVVVAEIEIPSESILNQMPVPSYLKDVTKAKVYSAKAMAVLSPEDRQKLVANS